jgi:hypothetical protein
MLAVLPNAVIVLPGNGIDRRGPQVVAFQSGGSTPAGKHRHTRGR